MRAEAGHLRHWIGAPPYAVLPEKPEVLIIGPGGGREILTALHYDAKVREREGQRDAEHYGSAKTLRTPP